MAAKAFIQNFPVRMAAQIPDASKPLHQFSAVIQDHIRHEQTSALSLSFIRESFFHSFPCDILYPAGQIIGCLPFFLYPVQAARPIGLPHPQSLFPQVPCTIFSLCL
jgi:hypothetical protein